MKRLYSFAPERVSHISIERILISCAYAPHPQGASYMYTRDNSDKRVQIRVRVFEFVIIARVNGTSAMFAPRNSVTTVNTAIAHRMRAAGTSVGNGIIGETTQLAVFADFYRTLYCTKERSALVEADAQEPEPH